MKEKKKSPISTRLAFVGIAACARRWGWSREHVSRVLHGKRAANDRLRWQLAKIGIVRTVDGKEI